jgi:hypothetical protein
MWRKLPNLRKQPRKFDNLRYIRAQGETAHPSFPRKQE